MATFLYLLLTPEALVASMLPPREFGAYLATGTQKRPHGKAMFFEIAPGFESDYFPLSDVDKRCLPHADGQPKHSLYLGVYRALEHVSLDALGSLWVTTAHGRSLELAPSTSEPPSESRYHLYQEICPIHPLIASSLTPADFCRYITDASRPIHVPKLCFVELDLGGLATDPTNGSELGLPYHDAPHLRDCLMDLADDSSKKTKTVNRVSQQVILYRCVKTGFYVGDQRQMLFYPWPGPSEMESRHYAWWHCANDNEILRLGSIG